MFASMSCLNRLLSVAILASEGPVLAFTVFGDVENRANSMTAHRRVADVGQG